jgi:putative salt-induced outer membrane protein YdiY
MLHSSLIKRWLNGSALFPLLAMAGVAATTVGKNQAITPESPSSPWEVTAAAGLGLSKGNSDTLNASVQVLATYLQGDDEAILGANYFFGEADGLTNTNNFNAFAAYNRTLAGGFYAGLFADAWHDEISNLDYRLTIAPTLGYYLIKDASTLLALEGNIGYTWEDQGGVKADYVSYRLAQRFSHTLANGVKLTESVSWSPELEDSDNWLLVAQAGVAVPVSDHWAVGVAARYTIDNTPAAGTDKEDLAILATLSYSANGFAPEEAAGRKTLKAEVKTAALPSLGWTTKGGVTFGLNRGNSETLSLLADISSDYRTQDSEWLNFAGIAYGENGDNATMEAFKASTQFNQSLQGNLYAGVGAAFRHDDIAALDYLATPAAVLGYHLINQPTAKLSLEAGPGYTFEKVGGIKADYFAVQAAQRLAWVVCDGVTLTESVVYNGEAEDLNNYTLTASAMLEVDLSRDLAFRTAISNIYDATPALGQDENDLLLSAGIAVKF